MGSVSMKVDSRQPGNSPRKIVRNRSEEARVAVRNVRRDSIRDLREFESEKLISEDDQKRGEEELQKITDKYIEDINETGERKEAEIMEV